MNYRLTIFRNLTLLSVLSAGPLVAQDDPRPMDYGSKVLKQVTGKEQGADADRALALLRTVPPGDSLIERVLVQRMSLELSKSMFPEMLVSCELGIRRHGEFEYLFRMEKVVALGSEKKYAEAEAYADSCIKRYPANFIFPNIKALVIKDSGDLTRALALFKENVVRFPTRAEAHMALGDIAAQEGKTAQAALCYAAASIMHHGSDKDESNLGNWDQLLGGTLDVAPKGLDLGSGDDFEEIDLLLKNRVAMAKGYKLKPDLDYPMCRQSHLLFTYLTEHSTGDGFWSTFYAPLFKRIMADGLFEGFVYNGLSSAGNEKIQAMVKKKMSVVQAFRDKVWPLLMEQYQTYPDSVGGTPVKHWYSNQSNILGIGEGNTTTGVYTGPWTYYHDNGTVSSEGTLSPTGKHTGTWYEYNADGSRLRTRHYDAEGIENGVRLLYYRTGALNDSVKMTNDKPDGQYHHQLADGTLKVEKIFVDGKVNGPATSRFSCGAVENSYTLADDEPEGAATSFYPDGAKQYTGTYTAGKRTGIHTTFYHNGQKETEYAYQDGKANGPFAEWWPDGTMKRKATETDDLITGVDSSWDANGALANVARYDAKGRTSGIQTSFVDGRPYAELEYTNDLLMRYRYIGADGVVLSQGDRKKGKFQYAAYTERDQLRSQGSYLDEGLKDGVWKYFYPDGALNSEENYVKGRMQGMQRDYYKNGKVRIEYDYGNGDADRTGPYRKFYLSGKPEYIGWLVKGQLNGSYRHYLPDGTLVDDEYCVDGDRSGWQDYFDVHGKPVSSDFIVDGKLHEKYMYGDSGKVVQHYVVPPGAYSVVEAFADGKPMNVIPAMNGTYHGAANWYYPDGSKRSEGTYVNGKRDGIWTWYFPNGKKQSEEHWVMGEQTGQERNWYRSGKLLNESTYAFGEIDGAYLSYWENGKVSTERHYKNGEQQGMAKNFAEDGTPQLARLYSRDELIGYAQPKAGGAFGDTAYTATGTVEMKTFYTNGKPSREFGYLNGELHGPYKSYHPNGQLEEEEIFEAGVNAGADKEYYANGQLREVTNYDDGLLHGEFTRYAENGKMIEQGTYHFGSLEGDYKVWDNAGKLIATYGYTDGVLTSMH